MVAGLDYSPAEAVGLDYRLEVESDSNPVVRERLDCNPAEAEVPGCSLGEIDHSIMVNLRMIYEVQKLTVL